MKQDIGSRRLIMEYLAAVGAVTIETDDTVTEIVDVQALSDCSTLIIPAFIKRVRFGIVLAEDAYGINKVVMHGDLPDLSFLQWFEQLEDVEILGSKKYYAQDGLIYDVDGNLVFIPPQKSAKVLEISSAVRVLPATLNTGFLFVDTLILPSVVEIEDDVLSGCCVRRIIAPNLMYMGRTANCPELQSIEARDDCIFEGFNYCNKLIRK